MQVKIKDLTGMLKEARCRAEKGEFVSADAVISFFEDRFINLCLEQYQDNDFDIAKFQEESRPVDWMNRQRQTQRQTQANKNKIGIDVFRNRNQENQDTEVT